MNSDQLAPLSTWLIEPMEPPVAQAIERIRRAADVVRVAVMPDVHLATGVCVGTVLATSRLLYPQAVGGDIGCGMLALAFDAPADALASPTIAGQILARLNQSIPTLRRHRRHALPWPDELANRALSHPALEAIRRDEGALQLGTLGSGNHFVELQADGDHRLWLMIHTGSRSMGQAIRDHHTARATPVGQGLAALDADTPEGAAYAHDVNWARAYADANRRAITQEVATILADTLNARPDPQSLLTCDHNHVTQELHDGLPLWVHRKGAMPADQDLPGILPGSMASPSFHVTGRGHAPSLRSASHGAGRRLSRHAARKSISPQDLRRQMGGIWYDYRHAKHLREESPTAYKDIHAVLRAQHDLLKVTRTLRPLLNYKGP